AGGFVLWQRFWLPPGVASTSTALCRAGGTQHRGVDSGSQSALAAPQEDGASLAVSALGRLASAAELGGGGQSLARLGLANGGLAARQPRSATLALCPSAGLGSAWLAGASPPAPRAGVAAGGMAAPERPTH